MSKVLILAVALIFFHLLILINIQFTAWPEMFSYPFLMNNGFEPYRDIAFPYQPLLLFFLVGVFKIFGFNLLTLQVLTWLIILISDLLILIASLKIIGFRKLSLLPLGFFLLAQPLTLGNMLWFDLSITPLMLAGLLSLFFLQNSTRWFLFGLFLSTAVFIKQQAALVIFFLLPYFFVTKYKIKLLPVLLGGLLPALIVLIYVLSNGLLKDWVFWTVEVPLLWYPKFPGYVNWPSTRELLITILLFVPFVSWSILNFKKIDQKIRITFFVFIALFITSFPRFEFLRMQPALAVYTLLMVLTLPTIKKRLIIFILPILTALSILIWSTLPTYNLPTRFWNLEDLSLASSIKNKTNSQDKIYLLGVNSLHYVLADRLPFKPWVDNYVWYMEIPTIQERIIDGFEKDKPRMIFWKRPLEGNWYDLGVYHPVKVVKYIESNYEKIDMIDQDIEIWLRKD